MIYVVIVPKVSQTAGWTSSWMTTTVIGIEEMVVEVITVGTEMEAEVATADLIEEETTDGQVEEIGRAHV